MTTWVDSWEEAKAVEPPDKVRFHDPLVPKGCPLMLLKKASAPDAWIYVGPPTVAPDGEKKSHFQLGDVNRLTLGEAMALATKYRQAAGPDRRLKSNRQIEQPPESPNEETKDSESFINGGRFSVHVPEGWRKDAEIAAAIEGKNLGQFFMDAILEAIKRTKEKEAMKAVQTLIDSGITLDRITELFNRLNKEN